MLFNHVGVGRFPHEDVRMHFHSPLPPPPPRFKRPMQKFIIQLMLFQHSFFGVESCPKM